MTERTDTVSFTLRLPRAEYDALAASAAREHRTLTGQIRHALTIYRRHQPQTEACPHGLPRGMCAVCLDQRRQGQP
jgi:hypothetical protein